jgi:prepilin-type N-terminal cleavage/methylation domain-containing protein
MRTTRPVAHSRHAFTLIEMLATMAIILVLAGILLRMMATFDQERRVKQAVAELEALRNALNEYFIEYGHYPPVDFMAYEFEDNRSNKQSMAFKQWLTARNNPNDPGSFFPDIQRSDANEGPISHRFTDAKSQLHYKYGLVSYLWKRAQDGQAHWYDRDLPRDEHAKERWNSYLAAIALSSDTPAHTSSPEMINTVWSNMSLTVNDPWGAEYRYESKPPFQRYRLWSKGPDGHDGTADDIARDSFNE